MPDLRPAIEELDTLLRPLLDAYWKQSPTREKSMRAARVRDALERGNLDGALAGFARTSPSTLTHRDLSTLVDLAIDEGDFDTVTRVYETALGAPVPRDDAVRCGDIKWRRFRDLLASPESMGSSLAGEALDIFLWADEPARARRLGFQLLAILEHARSYRLWALHRATMFRAFTKTGTQLSGHDLEGICDWALERLAELETSTDADGDEEVGALRGLVVEIQDRTVATLIDTIEGQ